MSFQEKYDGYKKLVENFLEQRTKKKGISKVDEAMCYSLSAGGKRLRPILLMATAETLGKKGYNYLPVAAALEMIHTYSLIHDDLPCMDDDDLRRGKPTCHKVYGEAMAVLAGDGLLTLAFEVMLEQKNVPGEVLVEVAREIAMCAGNFGMVGGQALDLAAEGKTLNAEEMRALHSGKTGAMFIAAVRSGARLAAAKDQELLALTKFADLFGLAFQIRDDILDVEGTTEELGKPAGSDVKNNKCTYVSLYGVDGAKALLDKTITEAKACLEMFGSNGQVLNDIADMLKIG